MKSLLKFIIRGNASAHRKLLRKIVRNRRKMRNRALVIVTIYGGVE